MNRPKILHGRCLVRIGARADFETSLYLPNDAPSPAGMHKPYQASLEVIGEPRRTVKYDRPVPTVQDLGWDEGDRVVCLKMFSHVKGHQFGRDDGEYALIDDFDILCRVPDTPGEVPFPNYGRTVIRMVAGMTHTASGVLVPQSQDPSKHWVGQVLRTAPRLDEELSSLAKGEKRGTLHYKGVVIDQHRPGDFVLFHPKASWRCQVGGEEFLIINNTAIFSAVDDPSLVESAG